VRRFLGAFRSGSLKRDTPFYTKDRLLNCVASVGDFTYGLPTVTDFGEGSRLRIGKFCSIAEDVLILLGGNHRTDWITTYPFPALPGVWPNAMGILGHPQSRGDVIIGNDVWIGTGATILSGTTIGDGAVIGARTVVTKNVQAYSIAVGNPMVTPRKRFSDEQVNALLRIRWWDWPIQDIAQHLPLLCSDKVDDLIQVGNALLVKETDAQARPQSPR
jgi:acetyltransferase-like isoleucine patch superfamily enzyme